MQRHAELCVLEKAQPGGGSCVLEKSNAGGGGGADSACKAQYVHALVCFRVHLQDKFRAMYSQLQAHRYVALMCSRVHTGSFYTKRHP